MRQPVVDTLRLSDTLRKAGMERDQAEGIARAFGKELGEHVAVQSDLDAGFRGVRSEMGLMRSELDTRIEGVRSKLEARIEGVRSEMALMRSELEARIEEVRSSLDAKIEGVRSDLKALNSKFNFGFGLLVALLVAVIGILLGPTGRSGTTAPTPPITINFPTAFSPTALPMAPAAPTDSTAPQDQDIASIAADRGSSEPR